MGQKILSLSNLIRRYLTSIDIYKLNQTYLQIINRKYPVKYDQRYEFKPFSGLGSSVGIVTGYGLDGPVGERDFPHLSRPTLRPT
jgi:hypothetical protein